MPRMLSRSFSRRCRTLAGAAFLAGVSLVQAQSPQLQSPPIARLPAVTAASSVPVASPNPAVDVDARLRELEQQLIFQQQQQRMLEQEVERSRQELQQFTAVDAPKKEEKKDDKKKEDEGHVVGSDLSMSAKWNHGLEVATKNKDFKVHVGGRTQVDAAWFSEEPKIYTGAAAPNFGRLGNTYGDGADFRRARLRVDGTMYEVLDWACEYDFVNSAALGADSAAGPGNLSNQPRALTAPTDCWVTVKQLPFLQNVRIGNQKEAIGFEHAVSSRFLPFMERSYNQDTFYGGLFNGFTPGIAAFGYLGEEEMATFNVGIFKPTNNVFAFNTGDGDYSVTGRLTNLWAYSDDGKCVLHTGISGRTATAVGQNIGSNGELVDARLIQYRTRDAIRAGLSANWPTPANITLAGNQTEQVNVELAGVYGRWTMQGEYLVSQLHGARSTTGNVPDAVAARTVVYHGGYFQLLYFLTDDHDHYSKERAAFDRVSPNENYFRVADECGTPIWGRGAWQVGARYNYLDLNDNGFNGGILHNFTGGLNWFLNPNLKMQFNYMATYRDAPLAAGAGDGWINGVGTRMAWDF